MLGHLRRRPTQRSSAPPSALRVATGRADFVVAPSPLWQGMAFGGASRTRPVALATNVAVFTFQCTKSKRLGP